MTPLFLIVIPLTIASTNFTSDWSASLLSLGARISRKARLLSYRFDSRTIREMRWFEEEAKGWKEVLGDETKVQICKKDGCEASHLIGLKEALYKGLVYHPLPLNSDWYYCYTYHPQAHYTNPAESLHFRIVFNLRALRRLNELIDEDKRRSYKRFKRLIQKGFIPPSFIGRISGK